MKHVLWWRYLTARSVLAFAVIKHILLWPFVRRRGPKPWLAHLARESLQPTPQYAWPLFAGTSHCIGCGMCDALGEPTDKPSEWILSIAREPSTAGLSQEALQRLEQLAPDIMQICPTQVDVKSLTQLMRLYQRQCGKVPAQ